MIQIKEENKLCKTKSKNKKEFAWFDNCLNKQMANEESLTIEIRKIKRVAQVVILHLLDIEHAAESLNGVRMEMTDVAFPLLKGMSLILRANSR